MTRLVPRILLLLSPSLAAACTPAYEAPTRTEIRDSAGLMIIVNRRARWMAGEGWSVSPEPLVVIGVLDGPEERQFVEVVAGVRLSDGRLVVADRGSRSVRLFDPLGHYVETLGGPGSGPGEFGEPTSVLALAGDSVVVWDQAFLRATTFDPRGRLVRVETVGWNALVARVRLGSPSETPRPGPGEKTPPSGLYPAAMEPMSDGSLLVTLAEKTGEVPPLGSYRPRGGVLRVSTDLRAVDTILLSAGEEQFVVAAPWGRLPVSPPLARRLAVTHWGNPPKICAGEQDRPEIRCYGGEPPDLSLRWSSEPAAVTEEDIADWRQETVQLLAPKLDRKQVLEVLDQVPLPEARPPYEGILLDQVGNLWVEGGPAGGGPTGAVDYLVFDPRGIHLGVVALPPIRVLEIGADYILGVQEDPLGVEYVVLYALRTR